MSISIRAQHELLLWERLSERCLSLPVAAEPQVLEIFREPLPGAKSEMSTLQ